MDNVSQTEIQECLNKMEKQSDVEEEIPEGVSKVFPETLQGNKIATRQ